MSDSTEIILHPARDRTPTRRRRVDDHAGPPPAIVAAAGAGAEFAWDGFFKGQIANAHTRKNYAHAVRHFLNWCDHPDRQVPLVRIAADARLMRLAPTSRHVVWLAWLVVGVVVALNATLVVLTLLG